MAQPSKQPKVKQEDVDRESRDSGLVSPERNQIVEEHFREHPEGDPAVRRIKPDQGEIPIEERHDDGFMTVRPPRESRRAEPATRPSRRAEPATHQKKRA